MYVRFQVLTAASMMFILHGSITQKTVLNRMYVDVQSNFSAFD
jgi:hypothetical protein